MLTAIILSLGTWANAQSGYGLGDVATDFDLKNIDETMFSMMEQEDAKGYILIFTCNHCPYSKLYEDRIIELDNKYRAKGFPVVAVNSNDPVSYPEDSFEEMKKRAKEKGFPFVYLIDETQEIARAYGATRTPHVFVLQKEESKLRVRYIGAIDDNARNSSDVKEAYVEEAVEALLKGKKVKTTFTKAIGCSIKWAK
jgi:peroxiredoxin